jgi:glucose-1-phosphate cytidylyltransferase
LRHDIFDYIKPGEELVEKPFQRLIEKEQLFSYQHQGFWAAMDTFKDKITFDRMNGRGDTPWKVWEKTRA